MAKRRAKTQPQESRFILHRFNGDEIYRFESAGISAYATEVGVTLWFKVTADPTEAKLCEDTAEHGRGRSPNAEVGIDLPELEADKLVGCHFKMPGTKTDEEDSCKSLLYYFEHQPLRDNLITVVSRVDDRFWLRWKARTQDVNFYDGSKPETQVEIEGEFRFKDIEKWTLSVPKKRRGTQ